MICIHIHSYVAILLMCIYTYACTERYTFICIYAAAIAETTNNTFGKSKALTEGYIILVQYTYKLKYE